MTEYTDGRLPTLPADVPEIEGRLTATGARMLVIDPLMAYLAGTVNAHRDQDVRRALAPLAGMADRTGVAVVVVRHLNKGSGPAIYRGGGSIGISGAARSVLLVGRDPDADPNDRAPRLIVAVVKSNLAPTAPSMAYRLVDDTEHGCACIRWDADPTSHTAADLVSSHRDDDGHGARGDAVDVLLAMLAEGPMNARDLLREAANEGISDRTLQRAKARLGVESKRVGFGRGSCVRWSLPEHRRHIGATEADPEAVALMAPMTPMSEDGPVHSEPDHRGRP
jgi:hypothetical protein